MIRKTFILNSTVGEQIKDILKIFLGTMLMGIGYSVFLMPFQSCPGGISGVAQLLYYLIDLPVGVGMILFNIPLFIIGIIFIGKSFSLKTVLAIILIPIFTEGAKLIFSIKSLAPYIYMVNGTEPALTNEILLGVIAGSLFIGAGLGIVIRSNASTGGTDIPALLMRKHFGLSIGSSYILIDTCIITISGILLKNPNSLLWSLVALFLTSRIANQFIEGFSFTKAANIITDKPEEIKNYIIQDLGRSCTVINAIGGYTNTEKKIIYVVFSQRELARLKINVKHMDPEAFIIVNDVHQVLGLGFKRYD